MSAIRVQDLQKTFSVAKKNPGLRGTLKSFVVREYTKVEAVRSVSFSIDEGELVGFIGPNGAGKTTTLKMLSGLLYPTSGKTDVLGFTPFERKHEFLKQISLVMGQKNQLWWDLPAIDTFSLNKEIYEIDAKQFKITLDELIELLDVSDILHTQVRKLSLGQRMKMELIAALLHQPKVLFLDEPTIGLDVVMQQKMRSFVKEYNRKYNATIILTSHYMDDVKELCKRIIIIDHGSVLYDGLLSDIVHTYAPHKSLTIQFEKKVKQEELSKFGIVESYTFPTAVLRVKRASALKTASQILNEFDIADLNIEEPKIEDIIRDVFEQKK
ncbi:ABC transporter [Candidatus Cerribacteria bacterium 'Amazon FNV 2010 28 9']|uniref:ABC transporter n=1 Tax=Candidatus Cerribacteria bacterium 'Amazon FNV 2010 28 9' TaxID=2081795 RepID=A0A317JNC8_9BACT|nr:MAG: ABC transporter [Candidatus Cerribacteria bacterium 'Amazon FNV 2010 28 9']